VPKLDAEVRDAWLADTPLPLAEAVAALELVPLGASLNITPRAPRPVLATLPAVPYKQSGAAERRARR